MTKKKPKLSTNEVESEETQDQPNLNDIEESPEDSGADESPPSEESSLSDEASHPDTLPPPGETHGFLEQFEALSANSISELEEVCKQGLSSSERVILIKLGMRLATLGMAGAAEEDFSAEDREAIESTINELTSL